MYQEELHDKILARACVRACELACFQNDGAQRNASRRLLLRNPGLLSCCTLRTGECAWSGGIVFPVPWRNVSLVGRYVA
jgi:hypothetical protein